MEQTLTIEGLVRRTIIKDDGRFLSFYNVPGEDQPIAIAPAAAPAGNPKPDTDGEAKHV